MTTHQDIREALNVTRARSATFTVDEVEALLQRQAASSEHAESLRTVLDATLAELRSIKQHLAHVEHLLHLHRTSTWWRFGAPFRAVLDRLKRRTSMDQGR